MGSLLNLIGGPIKGLIDSVGGVLDKLTTTDKEKLEAKQKLLEIERDFQVTMATLDAEWAKAQRDVIVAEATGHSWLQRNWRPLLMLFFAFIIGTVVWTGGYINGRQVDHDFVMEVLNIVKLGIGGYVVGRSAEKVLPNVTQIFASNGKK